MKRVRGLVWAMLVGATAATAEAEAVQPRATAAPSAQKSNMESRMRIARADRAFEETRDAAREIAQIAAGIADRVRETGAMGSDQRKPLDRMRKLAKKIRSDFGGEGDPRIAELPKTLTDIAAAMDARARAIEEEFDSVTRYEVNSKLILLAGDLILLSEAAKAHGTAR